MKVEFEETNDRYVAFLDIMGFKNMIYQMNHEDVKSALESFQNIIQKNIADLKEVMNQEMIKQVIFSDSVLMISKDDSAESLLTTLISCSVTLADCFEKKIPIKGAISFGRFTANFKKSLFVGRPLISAYELGEELHFYGIAVDHNVEKEIVRHQMNDDGHLINKEIPTKSGYINHTSIKWEKYIVEKEKNIEQIIKELYNTVSGKPRKYVDNSLKYYSS